MKLYRILHDKNQNKWNVFEIRTEQVVKSCDNEEQAKRALKKFKGAFGFNGWTPSFFLIDVKSSNTT